MKWIWDFKRGKIKSEESGYVMIMAIFVMVILTLIGVGLAVVGANEFQLSARTRLMDTAYQLAEAGISRACVRIKEAPQLVLTTGSGANNYLQTSATAQWRSGSSPNYTENFGVSGWAGTYSASIWQSELVPDNSFYKVVVSTGKITRNGDTAERTIETRIVAGPATSDYDASFDYCIFNGFYGVGSTGDSDYEAPTDSGVWPGTTSWIGSMGIDGVTPYNNHSPKGAIYTRGSINFPSGNLPQCAIHGNIVATKDITLSTPYGLSGTNVGISIDNLARDASGNNTIPVLGQGNVVAGLGGTGKLELDIKNIGNQSTAPLSIYPGWVVAPNDIKIDAQYAQAPSTDKGSIKTGGIITGGNLTVTKTGTNTPTVGCTLGNIFCVGTANITSVCDTSFTQLSVGGVSPYGCHVENKNGKVTVGAIYSMGPVQLLAQSNNTFTVGDIFAGSPGVESVNINANAHDITTGNITAQGGVSISGNSHTPTIGDIVAGIDNGSSPVGSGVNAAVTGSRCNVGSITAVGSVTLNAAGTGSFDYIWSGSDVTITLGAQNWVAMMGDISAHGDVSFTGNITFFGAIPIGRISADGNASVDLNVVALAVYPVAGIKAGGNASFSLSGAILAVAWSTQLDPWNQGPGTPDNAFTGYESDDSIVAGGNIAVNGSGFLVGILVFYNAKAAGTISTSQAGILGSTNQNYANLVGFKPGVDIPPVPAPPWTYGPTTGYPSGSPADTESWLKNRAPIVDQNLLLLMASRLETPVMLLEPNWTYFSEQANDDEGRLCPYCLTSNPRGTNICQNCGKDISSVPDKKAHVIKDTGLASDGDYDGVAGNKTILFRWDARNTNDYGSHETIYQDDPNVTVKVSANWTGRGSSFTSALVAKGGILISNDTIGWSFDAGQQMNLISGRSIKPAASGMTLITSDNEEYHFWARGNIDFSNMIFSGSGATNFRGSFTAGNRFIYSTTMTTTLSNWQWTRWSLDSRAWLPPFTVLSYKEI